MAYQYRHSVREIMSDVNDEVIHLSPVIASLQSAQSSSPMVLRSAASTRPSGTSQAFSLSVLPRSSDAELNLMEAEDSDTLAALQGGSQPQVPTTQVAPAGGNVCTLCQKTFSSRKNLRRHYKDVHVERKFVCSVCDKRFKRKLHLKNHAQTHTGERPFACENCGKSFPRQCALKRHKLIHTGKLQ